MDEVWRTISEVLARKERTLVQSLASSTPVEPVAFAGVGSRSHGVWNKISSEEESNIIIINMTESIWKLHENYMKSTWKLYENDMKTTWRLHENYIQFTWNLCENNMKTTWNIHEMISKWNEQTTRCRHEASSSVHARFTQTWIRYLIAILAHHVYRTYACVVPNLGMKIINGGI